MNSAAEVSEFDTLDEYKADVKAKIKEEKAKEGKAKKEDQVICKSYRECNNGDS